MGILDPVIAWDFDAAAALRISIEDERIMREIKEEARRNQNR
jgi:hypothetical protein